MHVICLHEVRAPAQSLFEIEPDELRTFVQRALAFHTFCAPSFALRATWIPGESSLVALTFDDGHRSSFELGLELMKEHGVSIGLAPVSSRIGLAPEYVDVADLEAWLEAGGELLGHTCSHARLGQLPRSQVVLELDRDLGFYAAASLGRPAMFAYPYGELSRVARAEVARRYTGAFATGDGRTALPLDAYALRRTTFRRNKLGALLMLDWERFERGHASVG